MRREEVAYRVYYLAVLEDDEDSAREPYSEGREEYFLGDADESVAGLSDGHLVDEADDEHHDDEYRGELGEVPAARDGAPCEEEDREGADAERNLVARREFELKKVVVRGIGYEGELYAVDVALLRVGLDHSAVAAHLNEEDGEEDYVADDAEAGAGEERELRYALRDGDRVGVDGGRGVSRRHAADDGDEAVERVVAERDRDCHADRYEAVDLFPETEGETGEREGDRYERHGPVDLRLKLAQHSADARVEGSDLYEQYHKAVGEEREEDDVGRVDHSVVYRHEHPRDADGRVLDYLEGVGNDERPADGLVEGAFEGSGWNQPRQHRRECDDREDDDVRVGHLHPFFVLLQFVADIVVKITHRNHSLIVDKRDTTGGKAAGKRTQSALAPAMRAE